MADIAGFGVKFDTSDVKRGGDEIAATGDKVDQTFEQIGSASERAQGAIREISEALLAVGGAFAVDKATDYAKSVVELADRYDELGIVLTTIGKNVGESQSQLEDLKNSLMTTGISAIESRQAIASLIQAQLDLGSATKLARVAQDAAVIGQLNSSDAYQRLIAGIVTGRVEILRTMGIQANWTDGYAKLAASIGVSTTDLTQQQQVQARLNTVLQAGTQITGAYETAMENAGKQMRSSVRYVQDLEVAVGEVFSAPYTAAVGTYVGALDLLKEHLGLTQAVAAVLIGSVTGLASVLGVLGVVMAGLKVISLVNSAFFAFGTALDLVATEGVAATAALFSLGQVVTIVSVFGLAVGAIGGVIAALKYFGVFASSAERSAKDLGDRMADVSAGAKVFAAAMQKAAPTETGFGAPAIDETTKAIKDSTAALADASTIGLSYNLTMGPLANAMRAIKESSFANTMVDLNEKFTSGQISLQRYEEWLKLIAQSMPTDRVKEAIAAADVQARSFAVASGRIGEVDEANKALADSTATVTTTITLQTLALQANGDAWDKLVGRKPSSASPSNPMFENPIISQNPDVVKMRQKEADAAYTAAIVANAATRGKAALDEAKVYVKAFGDAKTVWESSGKAQVALTEGVHTFADALKNVDPAIGGVARAMLSSATATALSSDALSHAETLITRSKTQHDELAKAIESVQAAQVESLKADGDVIGAAQAEYSMETTQINQKYVDIVAHTGLSAAKFALAKASDLSVAKMKEEAAIRTALAAQERAYQDQMNQIAAQQASNAVLEAENEKNLAAAATLSLQEKHDAITRSTAATIAATNAQGDLTVGQKLWSNILTIVHGQLQQHNVDLQETAKNVAGEKTLMDDIMQADGALAVAQLKSSGQVKAAKAAELALSNEIYAQRLRENALYQSDPVYKSLADRLIVTHDQTAALEEQTATVAKLSTVYTQMATDMDRTVRKAFEDIFTQGQTSWESFFDSIRQLFEKLLADMAASAIEKDVAGLLTKNLSGATGSSGGKSPALDVTSDQSGGIAPATGAATGINPLAAAGIAVVGIVSTIATGLFAESTKMMNASIAYTAAELAFSTGLQDFVDKTTRAAQGLNSSSVQTFLDNVKALAKGATDAGDQSPFMTKLGENYKGLGAYLDTMIQGFLTSGDQHGLDQLRSYLEGLASSGGLVGVTVSQIDQYFNDMNVTMQQLATATKEAGIALTNQVAQENVAANGGAVVNSFNKLGTDAATEMADALALGLQDQLDPIIQGTLATNQQNFIKALSIGDLTTLIPQLSGGMLTLAQNVLKADEATRDLAATEQNNTAIGGLDSRLATATAGSDPQASAAYAEAAHAQQQLDERLKAQAQLASDTAANMGPAVIAQDNYLISLIATTQAAEDAADAAAKLAAQQKLQNDQTESNTNSQYRIAVAQGNTVLAKSYADVIEKQKETDDYNNAIAQGFDKDTASAISLADATEYAAKGMADAAAAAKASRDYDSDIATRNAALVPINANLATSAEYLAVKNANLLALQDKQTDALNTMTTELNAGTISQDQFNSGVSTMKKEWDSASASFDGTIGGITSSVHDLAVAAQILADNTNSLTQQWDVFGTSLDDQVGQLAKLYGFTGMSDDQVLALFTKTTAGQELTDSQIALNKEIQTYIDAERAAKTADDSAAAATTPTAAAATPSTAASVTFGSTTPIIGPGGTFYTNVVVQVDPNTIKNGAAIGDAIIKRLDTAWGNKAALIRDASGQT